ncbi:UDP-N-acetylmuramoyl-tripeptide--D-alanyl-D-alanine ligase [Maribrevibacterium harenarium]|uniref:UDP-N-acetylmuramoyl-tripeptide--D-alanyl-D-alanine ligase n=1 Tax=Maribrevibacterium harenarium TaxID=2589817 RepID=A0A501WU89_9GAMM|nr:UDP-N-acetylmuramoyl-tripeptide--D-alanyl-D-alanine ligase [Maribrevibacterium harenarium]TPE51980.1 UDP-N-acetylmuramoyl-tripeptide--D-alanyl-D-alanine ligase [Maribrevibacterium harenarium]
MLVTLSLERVAQICHGRLVGADAIISSIETDTRGELTGALFVALSGEHFDGHAFVEQAMVAGAVAVLVERPVNVSTYVLVADTREAYGLLANHIRQQFQGPVVAITGSNGKTSVKDWLAATLAHFVPTLKTQANLNNQIGVPKTLLGLSAQHGAAVIEAGTSFPGEIPKLGRYIQADIVILTNASGSHLAGFGSTRGIAEEKGALISTAKPDATIILNADDPHFSYWVALAGERRVWSFSFVQDSGATLICQDAKFFPNHSDVTLLLNGHSIPLRLQRPGRHQVANAMAVCLAMLAQGYDLAEFLSHLSVPAQVPGRMEMLTTKTGALLVNDCYNASPKSVEAAIDVLALQAGTSWLVLGALGELGEQEAEIHAALGRYAAQQGIQHMLTLGPVAAIAAQAFAQESKAGRAQSCATKAEIITFLADLDQHNAVLVKGSRSAKMEEIVQQLVSQEPI